MTGSALDPDARPQALPMFPLGTVLLPGATLPLHVFEPRYRALVQDCLAGDRSFGVVLIERGSEVGGGDVRSGVGCRAVILAADELPDGRWVLAALGTDRIRVTRWLPDDPYPRAEVEPWPDDVDPPPLTVGDVAARLTRVLALTAELGHDVPEVPDLGAADDVTASYVLAALAPLGPLDRQHLLAAAGPAARLGRLAELLDDEAAFLARRLAQG